MPSFNTGDLVRCVSVPEDPEVPQWGSVTPDTLFRVLRSNDTTTWVVPVGERSWTNSGTGLFGWNTNRFQFIAPIESVREDNHGSAIVVGDLVRLNCHVQNVHLWGTVRHIEPGVDDLPLLRVEVSDESLNELQQRTGRPPADHIFRDENNCVLTYAEDTGIILDGLHPEQIAGLPEVFGSVWANGELRSTNPPESTSEKSTPRISKRDGRSVASKITDWIESGCPVDVITWGIELEFDSWGDFTERREFDSERAWTEESEQLSNNATDMISAAASHQGWGSVGRQILSRAIENIEAESHEEFLSVFGIEWSDLIDSRVDSRRGDSDDDCWTNGTGIPHVSVGRDGSVNGPECRTMGALNRQQLSNAIRGVFDNAGDASITTGCSAHIHAKIGDIHHKMDSGCLLYQCLMFALTDTIEQWPESQHRRLTSSDTSWFRPNTDAPNTKYSPMFCHPQGTLEFRLWGNAQGTSETLKRVEFTERALIEGYKTFAGDKDLLVYSPAVFADSLKRCFSTCKPLSSIIPQFAPEPQAVIESQTTSVPCEELAECSR